MGKILEIIWIKHLDTQIIFSISIKCIRLARTLFPVKSTNDIKVKKAQNRVSGGGWICEGTSFITLRESIELILKAINQLCFLTIGIL